MYVKDLHAGKFDAYAHVGQFVGYNFESKGYCIYWLAEGEKEKVIQAPMPNQSTNLPPTGPQVNAPQMHILRPKSPKDDPPDSESSNSVPFPLSVVDDPLPEMAETGLDKELEYGWGWYTGGKPPRAYKCMNGGQPPLNANVAQACNSVHQTTNWRLDNAIEATHFIKYTSTYPITH